MNNIQKILKAIRKINPNSQMNIVGEDIDTCTITLLENTTTIYKSDIKSKIPEVEQEETDEITEKANNKTSATNKLKALGLTDAEIEAL